MFDHVICLKFKNIQYICVKIKNINQYKHVKIEQKVFNLKGETLRKPCFIETHKSHNVNVKNKV